MSKKTPREWSILMMKELFKHAQRDDCFGCKQVLRAMGLDPEKKFEDYIKEATI